MTIDRYLRLLAGFFVMLSLALGHWVNPGCGTGSLRSSD
jgi:hypothetical protein